MKLTADRLDRISPSLTMAITATARALKAAGRDVIGLSAGEPDFDTPQNVKDAAIAAIQRGETKYTDVAGTLVLRQAVCARFKADHGLDFKPEEILVATGGKQVIFDALLATINPGDEAIIPAPCWVSYPDIVELAEGKPVIVPCDRELRLQAAAGAAGSGDHPEDQVAADQQPDQPDRRGLQPGGAEGADRRADAAPGCLDLHRRHLWQLAYDGFSQRRSLEVEPRLRDRTVTMNGCSKAYAMTGWRIGYAAAPVHLIKQMDKLQGQSTSNASSVSQAAAVEALNGPQEFIEEMKVAYKRRRDMVVELLNACPGLYCHKPEGAFYVFPSMQGCIGKTTAGGKRIETDENFCIALLEEAGVASCTAPPSCIPGISASATPPATTC